MRLVKIVPNDFRNASRDVRELEVAQRAGYAVAVVCKLNPALPSQSSTSSFPLHPLTTRPVAWLPAGVNRLLSLFTWAKEVRGLHPDVISCHDIDCLLIGWISLWRCQRRPRLIYDSHEYEYGRNTRRSALARECVRLEERFLMRQCAHTLVVNLSIAKMLRNLHHLRQRPVVVRNMPHRWELDQEAIAQQRSRLIASKGWDSSVHILLYHGGVTSGRGIETAIAALPHLDKAMLLVLGDGGEAYLASLRQLALQHKVQERVLFHEAVPYEELPQWVGVADVELCLIQNVCTSYYYSLPNKLFESIQALVPVVGSDFPEIRAIVQHYGVGEVCDPADAGAVAQAVGRLLDEAQPRRREALLAAKEKLCWERESVILEQMYRSLKDRL